MVQQKARKAGEGRLFPRVLVWSLALGLLLFPVIGLRSSLVLDASSATVAQIDGVEAVPAGWVCPDNMIAYWKLDETDAQSPPFVDSYNGHDGDCGVDCPRSSTGIVGNSQKFNGNNRQINVPPHADLNWGATDDVTIEFWFKHPVVALGNNEVAVGRDYSPAPGTPRHWWAGVAVNGRAAFYMNDTDDTVPGGVYIESPVSLVDNQWHHVVAIRRGSTGQNTLYVDGVTQPNMTKNAAFTAGFGSVKNLNIGWIDYGTQGFHFNAFLDELAIYGRALSALEIDRHWRAGGEGRGYCSTPQITVDKVADPQTIYAGTTVNYQYLVSNPGDVSFVGVTVLDDKCSPVTYVSGDTGNDGVLKPTNRETWTYVCSAVINEDTTNTVTASGTYDYPYDDTATDTGTAFVNVLTPAVTIVKTPDEAAVYAGDTVVYTYAVTNTSNDDLTNVTVVDDKCSPVTTTGDNTLAGGETQTYTCSAVLNRDTTNVATLTGRDALGKSYTFTGSASVDVIAPAVQFSKTASPEVIYRGDTVVYTYVATNSGNDDLTNVTVTDDKCSPVTTTGDNTLAGGEMQTYTCSTALLGDTTNTGMFAGDDVLGRTWTWTDTAFVRALGPQIAVAKTADKTVIYAGTRVEYTYTVTNPGDDPLTSIQLTDDKCAPLNRVGVDSNGKLDPGETWTWWCQSGSLTVDTTNTATATGRDSKGQTITSPPAIVTVDVIDPGIGLNKTAEEPTIAPGATAVYRYEVTNTGDDPLSSVSVTDDKCSPVTLTGGDTNRNLKLDVGETWIYGCSAVLIKSTTNTATAEGTDSAGGTVSASDTATVNVAIYLPFIRRP